MAQAHNYFFPNLSHGSGSKLIFPEREPRLRLTLLFGKNLSHDSEMQVLVKIGVLEKIWLWEMDFRVGNRGFGAKMGL